MSKGTTTCNRTACQKPLVEGAIYYNSSTKANYCPHCAYLINKHNPDLCKLMPPKVFDKDKHEEVVQELENKIVAMYPQGGLASSRDPNLVSEINRLSSYLSEVRTNVISR